MVLFSVGFHQVEDLTFWGKIVTLMTNLFAKKSLFPLEFFLITAL